MGKFTYFCKTFYAFKVFLFIPYCSGRTQYGVYEQVFIQIGWMPDASDIFPAWKFSSSIHLYAKLHFIRITNETFYKKLPDVHVTSYFTSRPILFAIRQIAFQDDTRVVQILGRLSLLSEP